MGEGGWMNKKEAIRILKTEKQYVCSAPGTYHLAYSPMIGFMRMNKYFKEFYKYEIVIYKNRHIFQNESWDQAFRNMKQLYDAPEKTRNIIKEWGKQKKAFFGYCNRLPEPHTLNDNEIVRKYDELIDRFAEIWAAPLVTDGSGVYTESELYEDFLKEIKGNDVRRIFLDLTQSQTLSFLAKNKLGLLKLTLKYRNKDGDFRKKLREHQREFFYVENTYNHIKYITEEELLDSIRKDKRTNKEISEEIRNIENDKTSKKQEKLFKKVRMSRELKEKLLLTQLLTTWSDERKELDLRGKQYQNEFLKEFGKRMGFSTEEMYHVQPKEIREFFSSGKKPSKEKIKGRMKLCVHITAIPFSDEFFEGRDAEDILAAYESIEHEKELKGTIASYGREKMIRGEVNIVMNPAKSDFRKGQILVTTMTRPEFVPLMHHAKAIITDEGGVTTHAGIVSRELGIACIVGTRSATKLLKTGDKVEIDMKTGEIRKI